MKGNSLKLYCFQQEDPVETKRGKHMKVNRLFCSSCSAAASDTCDFISSFSCSICIKMLFLSFALVVTNRMKLILLGVVQGNVAGIGSEEHRRRQGKDRAFSSTEYCF